MTRGAEIRAVGTAFTVRTLPGHPVQVLVQEGVVEVIRRDKQRAAPIRASAETQAVVPASAPVSVRPVSHPDVARKLAWQYGRIAMENETLADAAAEYARYSDTKIIVEPTVAGRTITGLFASNDPVGFAKVAAAVLDLHAEIGPNEIRIAP
jgi:transmembrane sensor